MSNERQLPEDTSTCPGCHPLVWPNGPIDHEPGCTAIEVTVTTTQEITMTDEQIKYMTDRFLGWRLPDNFQPDAGISFKPTFNDHMPQPQKYNPSGTNLFDAGQAEAMVRYMTEGMPRG